MENTKVAKAGVKVGVYTGIGVAVEAFVFAVFPSAQNLFPLNSITVGVSVGLASLVNYLKHRMPS